MSVKLLTEQHLEFLSLKEALQAGLSLLHLSKCHIVGNHMSRLIYTCFALLSSTMHQPARFGYLLTRLDSEKHAQTHQGLPCSNTQNIEVNTGTHC